MPVTTTSAAVHITPVVIKTFLEHSKRKAKKLKDGKRENEVPQDDIFFDEAFHIVKAFIKMGTKNTIESLQAFTNTHVPTPYWAAVSPVRIPLSSCNRAADVLIDWFGPEELKRVVGGERWWQVRGLDGIDAEWVTQKSYLDRQSPLVGRNLSDEDQNILRMERLDRVMLYVHGGGYFWGSINTHRYQVIRYARKIKGRAFAVNYRKAPQYPWPCPLHDVLAAYLYLIQPPPESLHKPIPASKIVFAGDSAGGGLCVAALTVLRDLGLPMPAGAVLISPWVDMTHSFPSVMQNTATDIIPEHGFIAKPSTLWPVDVFPPAEGRVTLTKTNPPPDPGHGDTLKPSKSRIEEEFANDSSTHEKVKTQGEMLDKETPAGSSGDLSEQQIKTNTLRPLRSGSSDTLNADCDAVGKDGGDWEPRPPKVLMENPNAVPLELRSQIHQYATTEQLTHPLVSPVLQGTLGNLPPLYILAGDGEVLRDEVIYLAHRAAHPSKYPARSGLLRDGRRQRENVKNFTEPTRVHLQVFDGMCHVLTVFSFTESAKYAYRSIAEFVKHVSQHDEEHLARNPFPELHRPPSEISTDSDSKFSRKSTLMKSMKEENAPAQNETKNSANLRNSSSRSDIRLYRHNEAVLVQEVKDNDARSMHDSTHTHTGVQNVEQEQQEDIPYIMLIRERVDISGRVRPMEPPEQMQSLQLKPEQIGMIKEAPTLRWLKGQEKWDKRYKPQAERAVKKRRKLEAKADQMLKNALDQGLVHESQGRLKAQRRSSAASTHSRRSSLGKIQEDRRWGPLDLEDENPPPSAIAKRRDTPEALALLKKSIYHTAPVTHLTVPRIKAIDAIRAAFDPKDDPMRPPRQSASEQQVRAHIIPMHGLRMWDGLIRYIGRKTTSKVSDERKQATEAIKAATGISSPKTETAKSHNNYLPAVIMPTGD